MQEWGKWHWIIKINDVIIKFQNKSWVPAFGCPGFVLEFNNYSINLDDPMSLTSLLHGAPQLWCICLVVNPAPVRPAAPSPMYPPPNSEVTEKPDKYLSFRASSSAKVMPEAAHLDYLHEIRFCQVLPRPRNSSVDTRTTIILTIPDQG